jgi:hypothetical protein
MGHATGLVVARSSMASSARTGTRNSRPIRIVGSSPWVLAGRYVLGRQLLNVASQVGHRRQKA